MSKKVAFGMYWQCYGRQTVTLPDNIDHTDITAVKDYIKSNWADIGIPAGEYVSESDEFDEESVIEVFDDGDSALVKKHPPYECANWRCPTCGQCVTLTDKDESGHYCYKCPACGSVTGADEWKEETV